MSNNFCGNRIKVSDLPRAQACENLSQTLTKFMLLVGRELFRGAQCRKNCIFYRPQVSLETRRNTKKESSGVAGFNRRTGKRYIFKMLEFTRVVVANSTCQFIATELNVRIDLMTVGHGFQAAWNLLLEIRMESKSSKMFQGALIKGEELKLVRALGAALVIH